MGNSSIPPVGNHAEKRVIKAVADWQRRTPGIMLRRNNARTFYDPQSKRHVAAGFGAGSSDFIGWRTVTVTPEMVGQEIAQFVAVECKRSDGHGVTSEAQASFLAKVHEAGGVAGVVINLDQVRELLAQ